jgi:integrase
MNKTTQPVKSRKVLDRLLIYLKGKSTRDYMIAKVQLNTARRISDIVTLKVSDFVNRDGRLKEYITFIEKKTQKIAKIAINQELQTAILGYIKSEKLEHDDYLFQSRKGKNKPLSVTQVHRIFQEAAEALNLEDFGSHSLRKTWGYFCYKETRNIALIMDAYNHHSEKVTLRYIGISQDDRDVLFMNIRF